jgi:DNA-binding winged helix-turn-helix (wHTH) protein
VEPSLNRLTRRSTRGGEAVRLEPKMMDVLVLLARDSGQVVTKAELEAAVWPGVFISDSVLTRAVAGLRRAFGDDAQAPRVIETIAKRGYRLLVDVERAVERPVHVDRPASYGVGQWVRGAAFYGRDEILDEVLAGARNGLWLLGSRASGKTSTLKQLEWRAAEPEDSGFLPLFWDLQGGATPEALDQSFADALAEAGPAFASLGLDTLSPDCLTAIQELRRTLRGKGKRLLLLVDEAEELLELERVAPQKLRRMRRVLQAHEGVRTVLASGPRLWRLGEPGSDTSPFLHGFAPPLVLGPLGEVASRRLLRQEQRAEGPVALGEATLEALVAASGGHPFLLQLLGSRLERAGSCEAAISAVESDPSVDALFTVDHTLHADRPTIPNPIWDRWLARTRPPLAP